MKGQVRAWKEKKGTNSAPCQVERPHQKGDLSIPPNKPDKATSQARSPTSTAPKRPALPDPIPIATIRFGKLKSLWFRKRPHSLMCWSFN